MPTQKQFVDQVASQVNVPPATVARVIRAHNEYLAELMGAGEAVTFRGFGRYAGMRFTPGPAISDPDDTPAKKAPAKKAPAKKTAAKKAPAKKAPAKKAPAKKAPAKKTPVKKAPAKKAPAKRTAAKKTARR